MSGVNFSRITYFQCWLTTSAQKFINTSQSAAESLHFVKKFKMAAAAIFNYYFIVLDHPLNPFVGLKLPFKFRVNRLQRRKQAEKH